MAPRFPNVDTPPKNTYVLYYIKYHATNKEFQALWREINHKYAYTVEFDSDELIKKAIAHIDEQLSEKNAPYAKANIDPCSPAWLSPITPIKKD